MSETINTEYNIDPDDDVRGVIVEKHVHTQVEQPRSGVPSFIAGFLFAGLAAAVAAIVFLALSDSDDDGNINLEAPAVGVDADPGN